MTQGMRVTVVANTIDLSSLLAGRQTEILERWTQRMRREHSEKNLSRIELQDHLPLFFQELLSAHQAGADSSDEKQLGIPLVSPGSHGTDRLRVGFDLIEVIREYEILTECILDEVEALGGSVSIVAFRQVQRLLNAGRAKAVAAYVKAREVERVREHSLHIAFIAHELRNPLMATFMGVKVLRMRARAEDEWALSLLERNLKTLRELIDDVLIADRLQGHVELKREPLDLRALLEDVVRDANASAEQRHIALKVHAPDPLTFFGDNRLLRSAINNVLGNAIKFTHEGTSVTVRAMQYEKWIAMEIEDRCGGLPEGTADELFKPSVQLGEDRTGFGLGLAIVKQALEAHGGRVSVSNLPGKGCVFALQLPASTATP
jgi:signal transduction histidine kinase